MGERRTVGLYRGQSRDPQPQGWSQFVEQVRKAAQRKPNRSHGPVECLTNAGNDRSLWGNPEKYAEGRCKHVNHKTGAQCKKWALQGASRCNFHGGYRENPQHPGAVALYQSGELDRHDQHRKAMYRVYKRGREEEREAAKQAMRSHGLICHAPDLLDGMDAYIMDDNGRAWRRWIGTLKARGEVNDAKRANGKAQT